MFNGQVAPVDSSKAARNSARVFITMGPYQATGSLMGFPETSRKRTDFLSVVTATLSPRPSPAASPRKLCSGAPSTPRKT